MTAISYALLGSLFFASSFIVHKHMEIMKSPVVFSNRRQLDVELAAELKKCVRETRERPTLKEYRKRKKEPNEALEGRRLPVTISAISVLRTGTDRARQPSPSA